MAVMSSLSSSLYNTHTTTSASIEADTQYPTVAIDMRIDGTKACFGEELWRRELRGIFNRRFESCAERLCSTAVTFSGINKHDNENAGLVQDIVLDCHASESPECGTSVALSEHTIVPEQPTRYSSASSFTSTASGSSTGTDRSHATAPSTWSRSIGYSYDNAHSLAMAAREKHCKRLATVPVSNQEHSIPTAAHVLATPTHDHLHTAAPSEPKITEYYIRRAQERIKRQQPVRRPRFQDLVDKEAEELAAAIAASYELEILRLPDQDELECTEADVELQDLSSSAGSAFPYLPAFRGLESPRPKWSSGWDSVLDEEPADAEFIVHAPRAIRPIKTVEMLEEASQRLERLAVADEPF
ncbi:hypothetical protein BDP27DRAFT_1442019 [Rhodocollybia butyracea]|uniref:Uncharacterized protein n=1 Tax=Rhodocollybia butyracea TaxID=206335 RepID=A0A9P5Q2T2_9AGAR|nr:hypothetical protein BDP27DRAFT_1442019 [Rhodocollybia butyracea]